MDTLEALEARIKAILPEQYQDCYEDVQPVSMGSAGLKYDAEGRVEWDKIWATFCDLAMAGGPPHKGTLLAPGTAEGVAGEPEAYAGVVAEICRGVGLVTGLAAVDSGVAGWVRVGCGSAAAAGWLARAIVMENVWARVEGMDLLLPAGPGYRVHKEVKNVVTSTAKTFHYWDQHMWTAQQRGIARLFAEMETTMPLVQAERGWEGVACADVGEAIWLMRGLVASNVMARREETTLFVPAGVDWARVETVRRLRG